jgi:hypothetical protein
MTLQPCSVCQRHVFARDRQCPFCGALQAEREAVPRTRQRRGRAGLTLAVAATAVLAAGCGGATVPTPDDAGSVADLGPDLSHHTCYGAPPARA